MLKKLVLENWKSFRYTELPIDPLTILIGTNASGKSNAIEALELLRRISRGMDVESALVGNSTSSGIRGGIEWATSKSKSSFKIEALIQGTDESSDFLYSITVNTEHLYVELESLVEINNLTSCQTIIFHSAHSGLQTNSLGFLGLPYSRNLESDLVDFNRLFQLEPTKPILPYILSLLSVEKKDVLRKIIHVLKTLMGICVLDPIPSKMRTYSSVSNTLEPDCSNLSGVLAALPNERKVAVEEALSFYASQLPEKEIRRVWSETVGRLKSDAMLYAEEAWLSEDEPLIVDSRGMSDGTLRFLAILTALLTQPENSQLIIEEVDNGLHPSRAGLLLNMLKAIGGKRQIDILVTTHNPALLDALEPEMIPFVVVTHRDSETGESKLTPLDNIENLPKLLASGSLGKLAERGSIERSLSGAK